MLDDSRVIVYLILITICYVLIRFSLWLIGPILHSASQIDNTHKDKLLVLDSKQKNEIEICNIEEDSSINLTLVIPAYNEEERLPIMLDETISFLLKWSKKRNITYEILIVDDGSKDNTQEVVSTYMKKHPKIIRLLALHCNCGKGGAVKRGVSKSRGQYILMVDADGATNIEDLDQLYSSLIGENANNTTNSSSNSNNLNLSIAIGSRAHLQDSSVAQRSLLRTILMYGFHFLVVMLCSSRVRDTQCGFKLFSRPAAKILFQTLHLERWAFDVEVIYVAESCNIPIFELPVRWHEVEGSKLIQSKFDVITTSLTMARDMFCVRISYLLGIWRIKR